MRYVLNVSILLCFAAVAEAQNAALPATPSCNLYLMAKEPTLTLKQRLCMWTDRSLLNRESFSGAFVAGVYSQFTERSDDRGKGMAGLATRVGTKYAQSTAKGLGETFGGWIGREDLRKELGPWKPRPGSKFGARLGYALSAPFWNYREAPIRTNSPRKTFAWSRVAGAFSSGFVGMAWAPDRLNTPGRALRRSASAYGGYFSSSLLNEFGRDLRKLISWL